MEEEKVLKAQEAGATREMGESKEDFILSKDPNDIRLDPRFDINSIVGSNPFSLAASCHGRWGMRFVVCFALPCDNATEEDLRETDGLADSRSGWFARFFWCSKGYVKSELPDAFLVALDKHCGGEMPDHV